jgi:hypothetical protein
LSTTSASPRSVASDAASNASQRAGGQVLRPMVFQTVAVAGVPATSMTSQ